MKVEKPVPGERSLAHFRATVCAVVFVGRTEKGNGLLFSARIAGSLVVAAALAGCATVYEGKYDWKDGWREARVVRTGAAADLGGQHFSDCRDKAAPAQLATAQYAVLSYSHMSRPRRRVVPLAPGAGLRAGDLVYMNLRSCDAALERRTESSQ